MKQWREPVFFFYSVYSIVRCVCMQSTKPIFQCDYSESCTHTEYTRTQMFAYIKCGRSLCVCSKIENRFSFVSSRSHQAFPHKWFTESTVWHVRKAFPCKCCSMNRKMWYYNAHFAGWFCSRTLLLLLLPFILCSSRSIANQLSLWLFLDSSISLGTIIIYGRYKDIPHNLDGVSYWVLLLMLLLFLRLLLLALLTTTSAAVTVVAFCFDKQIIVYHTSIVSAHSFDDGIVSARHTYFVSCELLSQKYEMWRQRFGFRSTKTTAAEKSVCTQWWRDCMEKPMT